MFEKTDRPTFKNQRSDYLTELDKINSLFINSDLRGRKKIVSSVQEITQQNIKEVLQAALPVHDRNKTEIQELHDIFTGKQKIENRSKKYATAVNNKIVENHAYEFLRFTQSFQFAFPIKYASMGDTDTTEQISNLERFMRDTHKYTLDGYVSFWALLCGVGYYFIKPNSNYKTSSKSGFFDKIKGQKGKKFNEKPFEITSIDPRHAFCIYSNGIFDRKLAGVVITYSDSGEPLYNVVTPTQRIICNSELRLISAEPIYDGGVQLIEYNLNPERMGCFEPVVPLFDAINALESARVDGVEQNVDSITVVLNADVVQEDIDNAGKQGLLVLKGSEGRQVDVKLLKYDISQDDVQTTISHMISTAERICAIPDRQNRNGGGGDTGQAVALRTGYELAVARGRTTKRMWDMPEHRLIDTALKICRVLAPESVKDLLTSEIDVKFEWSMADNLLVKTQALNNLLSAGVNGNAALSTIELFSDPSAVAKDSPNLGKNTSISVSLDYADLPTEAQEKLLSNNLGVKVKVENLVVKQEEIQNTASSVAVENGDNQNQVTNDKNSDV